MAATFLLFFPHFLGSRILFFCYFFLYFSLGPKISSLPGRRGCKTRRLKLTIRNGQSTVGGPKMDQNASLQAKMDHFGPLRSRESDQQLFEETSWRTNPHYRAGVWKCLRNPPPDLNAPKSREPLCCSDSYRSAKISHDVVEAPRFRKENAHKHKQFCPVTAW